jgi:hypothetical protein
MSQEADPRDQGRIARAPGLTFRSFCAALFALLLMAIWINYQEIYTARGGPLAGNAPPNAAVATMLVVMGISGVLYTIRKWLALTRAEWMFLYCALLVAAPLMSGGLWHRLFSVSTVFPRSTGMRLQFSFQTGFDPYQIQPKAIWPHGKNLCANPRFQQDLAGYRFDGDGTVEWETLDIGNGEFATPVLVNPPEEDARTTLAFDIPRSDVRGDEGAVPGEPHLFTVLLRAGELGEASTYFVRMQADDQPPVTILNNTLETAPSYALPNRFRRMGVSPLLVPDDLEERLTFTVGLAGPGRLAIQDLELLNTKAVHGAYTGLTGQVPWDQWVRPFLVWSLAVVALFLGWLGINVVMRKHWAEHERLGFPMNTFPLHLFGLGESEPAGALHALRRNRALWLGFFIVLPLAALKGIHFYLPDIPAPPLTEPFNLGEWVTHPLIQKWFIHGGVHVGVSFSMLAIALMVEKDVLFSIWVSYLVVSLFYLMGWVFKWYPYVYDYPGLAYQGSGGFLALGLIALLTARKHLRRVFAHVLGGEQMDETQEIVSYRTALLLVAGSLGVLVGWGMVLGMGLAGSLVLFGWMLICGLVASRIRAEAGLPGSGWFPAAAVYFLVAFGGIPMFGSVTVFMASLMGSIILGGTFLFLAPLQVEMMELGRRFKLRGRDVAGGLGLGLVGGIVIGGFVFLKLTYAVGADQLPATDAFDGRSGAYGFLAQQLFLDAAVIQEEGQITEYPYTGFLNVKHNVHAQWTLVGFVTTCLLGLLRGMFSWFPIHPLGYVVAVLCRGNTLWFIAFLAWLIRLLVLKIGGVHSVRRGLIPCGVGMFLACAVSIIGFEIVGLILRGQGVAAIYSRMP